MLECHFWDVVMLRQSRLRDSRASPAQKSRGLRVVYSKNFSRATFFCFLGHSVGRYVFELFDHETIFLEKVQCVPELGYSAKINLNLAFSSTYFAFLNKQVSNQS